MILPHDWSVASYHGVMGGGLVAWSGVKHLAYRRCTVRDAIEVDRWAAAWAAASGQVSDDDLAREEVMATAENMAARVVEWPKGDSFTADDFVALYEGDKAGWAWLYGLLFAPILDACGEFAALAEAVKTVPGGQPGNAASTSCASCLAYVREGWNPKGGKFGRVALDGEGVPIKFPWERKLGDDICQACPKWDAEAQAPRPTLSGLDMTHARLAEDCASTKHLPCSGGILDQDLEIWKRVSTIARSPWFRAMMEAKHNV